MAGPTVRLAPATPEVTWSKGTALVQRDGTGVRVTAGFERHEGDALSMLVAVENQGAPSFEVDPRWVSVTPCRTADVSSCMPVRWAHDPEQLLASLEAQGAQEAIDSSNAQAALTVLAVLSAVVDVASIGTGRRSHSPHGTLTALGAHNAVAIRHQGTASALEARRQEVATAWLRRTTVAPGHLAAGRVLLPTDLDARYVWLHLRAGDQKFTIPFHQTVTHPQTTEKRSLVDRPGGERRPGDWGASAGFLH